MYICINSTRFAYHMNCKRVIFFVLRMANKLALIIAEQIDANPNIQIYKLGFLNNWNKEPLWQ